MKGNVNCWIYCNCCFWLPFALTNELIRREEGQASLQCLLWTEVQLNCQCSVFLCSDRPAPNCYEGSAPKDYRVEAYGRLNFSSCHLKYILCWSFFITVSLFASLLRAHLRTQQCWQLSHWCSGLWGFVCPSLSPQSSLQASEQSASSYCVTTRTPAAQHPVHRQICCCCLWGHTLKNKLQLEPSLVPLEKLKLHKELFSSLELTSSFKNLG